MNDRNTKRGVARLLIASVLALPLSTMPGPSIAAVQEPISAEPRPSARRTAARAIERHSSTQWLADVAERLRALENDAERAAAQQDAPAGARSRSLEPGRNSQ